MQERRRIDRKYLAIYSRVFDRSSGRVLGYLADLSQQGIMIISDDPLAENVIFNLRFDLPDPPLFSADHLDLQGRVAYCGPDVDPVFYNIGFEFLSVNAQEGRIIEEMMEAYEFTRKFPGYPPSPSAL
ncbi:MAG: PilZ domain-containing protein [Chloroflexi bacterium]|nr:PilZ domain-containing protein [Chloroflexota bacterium]